MKNFNGKSIVLLAVMAVSFASCNEEVTVKPTKSANSYSVSNEKDNVGDLDPITINGDFGVISERKRVVEIIIEK